MCVRGLPPDPFALTLTLLLSNLLLLLFVLWFSVRAPAPGQHEAQLLLGSAIDLGVASEHRAFAASATRCFVPRRRKASSR